ncbi:MAG: response regulator [Candidatus Micrarchaeota archaeon]
MSLGTPIRTGKRISGQMYTPELAHRLNNLREKHVGAREQWEKPTAVLVEGSHTFSPERKGKLKKHMKLVNGEFCDTVLQANTKFRTHLPSILLTTTNFVLGAHNPATDLARMIRSEHPATVIVAIEQGEIKLNNIERRLFDLVFERIEDLELAASQIRRKLMQAKIAIFDDETSIVDFYHEKLYDQVRIVSQRRIEDVDEALRISRLAKPDIIIIDLDWTKDSEAGKRRGSDGIYLPEGLEFIGKLRLESPETIVILQSASVSPEDRTKELEARIENARFDAIYKKFAGEKIVRTVLRIAHEITQEELI